MSKPHVLVVAGKTNDSLDAQLVQTAVNKWAASSFHAMSVGTAETDQGYLGNQLFDSLEELAKHSVFIVIWAPSDKNKDTHASTLASTLASALASEGIADVTLHALEKGEWIDELSAAMKENDVTLHGEERTYPVNRIAAEIVGWATKFPESLMRQLWLGNDTTQTEQYGVEMIVSSMHERLQMV